MVSGWRCRTDQNERDYETFMTAIQAGRLQAEPAL
jgi:hypothetical protein